MIKYLIILLFGGLIWGSSHRGFDITSFDTVAEAESALGYDYSNKKPLDIAGVSVEKGRMIVHEGFYTNTKGRKSKQQSKHFVCTSCHNTVQEDPDLSNISPEKRLAYAQENNLPFLQGTTLYGAVNRKTYYNGDYDKKYGSLVENARNDIRGAIQLCAVECAQGRALTQVELESVLAYMWSLELKVDDLNLPTSRETIKDMSLVDFQKYFPQAAAATFIPPPADRKSGNGKVGNADNGKIIYNKSCLHCHYQAKYSFLHLDDTALSLKYLKRHLTSYHPHSLYQVTRWGVPTKSGKNSYMPQYPIEKLSEQQMADLVAYIQQ